MTLSLKDKIVGFIVHPTETFHAVRSDSMGDVMTYFALLLVINAILSALVAYFGLSVTSMMPGSPIASAGGAGGVIAAFIFAVIVGIIGLIISSIFLHLGVILMGGQGGFGATFKAVVFALTPYYVLGWLPVIGLFAGLWGWIIEIIGVRELHELTSGKAFLAWLISLVIIVIIGIVLTVLLGAVLIGLITTLTGAL